MSLRFTALAAVRCKLLVACGGQRIAAGECDNRGSQKSVVAGALGSRVDNGSEGHDVHERARSIYSADTYCLLVDGDRATH
jgi:hypothetical protein